MKRRKVFLNWRNGSIRVDREGRSFSLLSNGWDGRLTGSIRPKLGPNPRYVGKRPPMRFLPFRSLR